MEKPPDFILKIYQDGRVFYEGYEQVKILGKYEKDFRQTAANFGIKVKNKDELDAYLCCLTGMMFLERNTIAVGDDEGKIIIPKL